jgi:putative membrane protein
MEASDSQTGRRVRIWTDQINLVLRVPVPTKRRGRLQREITKTYLSLLRSQKKSKPMTQSRGESMSTKTVVIATLVFLFALLVIQNAQTVEVRFLFWKTEASRAIVLLLTFGIGFLAGWLARLIRRKPYTAVTQGD